VFVSEGTRAVIYVFADDHCPHTFTPGTVAIELNKTRGRRLHAKTAFVTKISTTAITTSLKRNWWLISLYIAVEFFGAGVGASLSGWGGFGFSIGIDVVSTIIGLYAVIRVVREVTREPA
jgi:hypothetical protein